jgi:hypothetical protein
MRRKHLSICIIAASILPANAFSQSFLSQYKGLPYHDSAIRRNHRKFRDESCAPTMIRAAKEWRVTTPTLRITAVES